MSYLFHHNKNFTFIDSSPKSGLTCQSSTGGLGSRPTSIAPAPILYYSAALDAAGKPIAIAMPDAYHINYYSMANNHVNKTTIASTSSTTYDFSNPVLYTLGQFIQLVYISHPVGSSQYSFIHQPIPTNASLTTLLTLNQPPSLLKSISTPDATYIFFVLKETYHTLSCIKLTATNAEYMAYLNSNVPIIDYSVCLENELVHISYVTEVHGQYQLLYLNTETKQPFLITTTAEPCEPTIFSYYHTLWINALLDKKLHIFLSTDGGLNFNGPTLATIQTHLKRCLFQSTHQGTLFASELYASIALNIKLCTIATIDFESIHADTHISSELSLLLNGLLHSNAVLESPMLTEMEPTLAPMPTPAVPAASIDAAKSAFMNQLNSWDLPPKL